MHLSEVTVVRQRNIKYSGLQIIIENCLEEIGKDRETGRYMGEKRMKNIRKPHFRIVMLAVAAFCLVAGMSVMAQKQKRMTVQRDRNGNVNPDGPNGQLSTHH